LPDIVLPRRLQRPTVEEAVFEVRFQPYQDSVVPLLPGILFTRLSRQYPKHVAFPLASLPQALKDQQPELRYTQQIRLQSEGVFSLFVGDRVAGASALTPYPGWEEFEPKIREFITVLRESHLIRFVERASFKYVNVLQLPPGQQLRALQASVTVAGEPATEAGFRLRTEHNDRTYKRVSDVATNVTLARTNGSQSHGLLISLDAVRDLPEGAGSDELTPELANAVHVEAKKLFFRLITRETLDSLGPEY
jgi:uncharacterized protein (TIGR04255 family)